MASRHPPHLRMHRPAYRSLGPAELRRRAAEAVAALEDCRLCPRDCGADRLSDKWGACKTGRWAVVGSHFPHFGEEDCLRGWNGSGTIFFSHCNLRCQFCFSPDTLVATDEGLRQIGRIFEEGDRTDRPEVRAVHGLRVPTVDGGWAPVVKAFRHDYSGELVRLTPYSAPPLIATPEHRLLVSRLDEPDTIRRVPIAALQPEDRLLVPKRKPGGAPVILDIRGVLEKAEVPPRRTAARRVRARALIQLFTHGHTSEQLSEITGYHPAYVRKLRGEWKRGALGADADRTVVPNDLIGEEGLIRFQTERRPGIPRFVELDDNLAWLLGFYCAEGHVTSDKDRPNSHHLVFSVSHDEGELAARVERSLFHLFGVEASIRRRRTTVTVEIYKSSLALLFALLCGRRSRTKRVPTVLSHAPVEVIGSYFDGVMAGDGTETDGHRVVNTVSPAFARGLYEVGLHLGTLPSYHLWKPSETTEIEGRIVEQRPLHSVKFPRRDSETGAVRTRWRETERGWLVPVRRTDRLAYDGPVYNLEVDHPEHAYLAPYVAVGNCQNYDISQKPNPGDRGPRGSRPEEIAGMMLELQDRGCHNINFVTPEHVVPQVLEAVAEAVERGLRLPIVYNTSAYDALESLRWMDGIVDIYMPDFKFWTAEGSKIYMMAEDYPEAARAAVKEMHRQVGELVVDADGLAKRGLIVRHLVMPGMLDETRAILEWVAGELGPGTYVNLMDQYYPAGRVGPDHLPEIDRRLRPDEFAEARSYAAELGLRRLDERRPHRRLLLRMAGR